MSFKVFERQYNLCLCVDMKTRFFLACVSYDWQASDWPAWPYGRGYLATCCFGMSLTVFHTVGVDGNFIETCKELFFFKYLCMCGLGLHNHTWLDNISILCWYCDMTGCVVLDFGYCFLVIWHNYCLFLVLKATLQWGDVIRPFCLLCYY